MRRYSWFAAFWAILGICLLAYWPGLQGGFLFDDFPNLSKIGDLGGVHDWATFEAFVFHGAAGPLGRPVALASFLLDATDWPADPRPFKLTNLWLHLLAGSMLCIATYKLLRLFDVSEPSARWGAVLNMALWLLHPYMVSTTLYTVQRMAQLAALFMYAGLAGYLHGRLLLPYRRLAGYIWMSAALILGTMSAALSKENGVLLPLLALMIEWCLAARPARCAPSAAGSRTSPKPDWRWRVLFLWFPTAAVVFQLGRQINLAPDAWPTRPFNQVERLLTEPRVLWEYLWQLYVPRIEGLGLFQDGYPISTDLWHPATTLPALVGIIGLLAIAVCLRHKWRWGTYIALALIFFLASHLIESTVIGLELYFEHRNYAAAAFLFLPLAMAIVWLGEKRGRLIAIFASISILGTLGALTWQRATLWSDTSALETFWAVATPNSPRAQNHLAVQYFKHGDVNHGFAQLEEAMNRLPDSALLSMQWLLQKITHKRATAADFNQVAKNLPQQQFDAQAVLGLRMIVETLIEPDTNPEYRTRILHILDVMRGLPQYSNVPLFNRLAPYLRALLLLSDGLPDESTRLFLVAMDRYKDIDSSLSMVAHMGNAKHPGHALLLLDEARRIYARQPESQLKRPRSQYDSEIDRLDRILRDEIRKRD